MTARIPLRSFALMCALAALIAGCAIKAPVSPVPQSYDLGPLPAYAQGELAIPGTLLIAAVRPHAPIDQAAIVYRLLYEDRAQARNYAMSRWVAEPASLVTDRLRSRLAASAEGVVAPAYGARVDYALRVELEDFSQHFTAPGQARVVLRARATLLSGGERTVLAQRVFEFGRAADGNAPGAVKSLSEATDEFIEALVKWTADNARSKPGKGAPR